MRKDDLLLLDEADVKPVHRHVEKGESKLGTQHSQHLVRSFALYLYSGG